MVRVAPCGWGRGGGGEGAAPGAGRRRLRHPVDRGDGGGQDVVQLAGELPCGVRLRAALQRLQARRRLAHCGGEQRAATRRQSETAPWPLPPRVRKDGAVKEGLRIA